MSAIKSTKCITRLAKIWSGKIYDLNSEHFQLTTCNTHEVHKLSTNFIGQTCLMIHEFRCGQRVSDSLAPFVTQYVIQKLAKTTTKSNHLKKLRLRQVHKSKLTLTRYIVMCSVNIGKDVDTYAITFCYCQGKWKITDFMNIDDLIQEHKRQR